MVSIPSLWSYHSFCPNLTLLSLKAAESAFIVKRERETESEKIAERLTICTKLYICRAEVTRQMYNRVLREKKKKKKKTWPVSSTGPSRMQLELRISAAVPANTFDLFFFSLS